ncbi:hypothetical protein OIU80_11345 [Flavobacterium sp. LS1R47]|uniref:Uncharacterized protein n=1 Tax=Flavobacterium frigoritolerans TaxID=2987686 RepID=A0A9X3C6X9_9FLAO|nr:hypothetical protein [Flavobacterium frigoritolerans]MCV9932879.1 hypothetical protein [Flavobacterium frigoritolerans]
MKNISFPLVILQLLTISCTPDTIDNTESIASKVSMKKLEKSTRLVQNPIPENPANMYDFAGKLHNDILDVYLAGNHQHTTIEQINQQIEAIATANTNFILLSTGINLSFNLDIIQEIVSNPELELAQAITNSTMTNAAKESLSSFMNDVILWENNSYEEIYQSVISYESSVIANSGFSNEDKRIILTTSSLVRYSIYYNLTRKDKDWPPSKGHLVGGLSGAIDNSSTAIRRSLVTGIMIYTQATH